MQYMQKEHCCQDQQHEEFDETLEHLLNKFKSRTFLFVQLQEEQTTAILPSAFNPPNITKPPSKSPPPDSPSSEITEDSAMTNKHSTNF